MANQEHVDILRQGVEKWNTWREQHPNITLDLSYTDLSYTDLSNVDLSNASVINTKLSHSDLSNAKISNANLNNANLSNASIINTDLSYANLNGADLSYARLSYAKLYNTRLSYANLNNANLNNANLNNANLSHSKINNANLSNAGFSGTILGDIDLRTVKGLDSIQHIGPSTIGTDTIERSQGDIPEVFLRGAGLSDTFIEYASILFRKPIEDYTCFISYSSKDEAFAKRLHNDLQGEGVRCWFAPEDMKIGDKIRLRIDESIRMYDKLLIVLSHQSLASTWVENEVETAFDKEQQQKKLVLFPITLDETIMQTNQAWAATIRRTRHIGNFTQWNNHQCYQTSFARLLRDLKAEGK